MVFEATESDYELKIDSKNAKGVFLPGTNIEIIREPVGRGRYRHALFDFDGTISLIREGWPEIMSSLMLEALRVTPNCESEEELQSVVRDLILSTTGKQTIYQMIALCEEVKKRGGTPLDPLDYKTEYINRLMAHIDQKREALRNGEASPESMVVSGSIRLLEGLRAKGVKLYLASGTDEKYVHEESALLNLTHYFDGHIYGAIDDYLNYSKQMVIERILKENNVGGHELLGFGDGYVEIDNTKTSGGTGIGVASDETGKSGLPDRWKRERLIGVGADIIIPDFSDADALIEYLFPSDPA
ncbi:MAG: HAD family hydrolase [Armatimonadota bacterium]